MTSTLPWKRSVIAFCHGTTLSGSYVALRTSVWSISSDQPRDFPIPPEGLSRNRTTRGGGLAANQHTFSDLALDPGRAALHDPLHLGEGRHRGVAGGRHREGAVRGAAVDRPLGVLAREEAEDEAGGEGVPAAHPVPDLQGVEGPRLVQ